MLLTQENYFYSFRFLLKFLFFAISSTSPQEICPTLELFGFEEPFEIFIFFLINSDAGGVFTMKVKLLQIQQHFLYWQADLLSMLVLQKIPTL